MVRLVTLVALAFSCHAAGLSARGLQQPPTPAPAGPFHVVQNRLVDVHGRAFPLRGTALPEVRLEMVVSFGSYEKPGMDPVTVEIPASLAGIGETGLVCRVPGRIANGVRIRIGGGDERVLTAAAGK